MALSIPMMLRRTSLARRLPQLSRSYSALFTGHKQKKLDVEEFVASHFNVECRQADAQAAIKGRTNVRVWSFESDRYKGGYRKYIAADIRRFYQKLYRECSDCQRHFYEIIGEGAPCRLYFDLEYRKQFNADAKPEVMMEKFIQTVIDEVKEVLQLQLDRDRSFMMLDSSNEEKFSSHVIVHMPEGVLFPSNLALKPLVQRICRQMYERQVGVVRADEQGKLTFLCDLAVYTRNRNFRLYRSSKCGKSVQLAVSEMCRFYDSYSHAKVFLDSLVVPMNYTLYKVLEMPDVLKSRSEKLAIPSLPSSGSVDTKLKDVCLRALPSLSGPAENSPVEEISRGYGSSPFPKVDEFMLTVFRNLNSMAEIRLWCLTISKAWGGRSIQYQLNNCRYCHNQGREHLKQNVYWVVDLDRFVYYQRCFDVTDCPKFESERWKLPEELVENVMQRTLQAFSF